MKLQPGRNESGQRHHFDLLATCVELAGYFRFIRQYAWEIMVFSGVVLRLYGLSTRREIWLDESMLLKNVSGISPWKFMGPLESEQVVPPGYLMMLRIIQRLAGDDIFALRLPSFLAATLAFVVFAWFVKKRFSGPVALMATALFACNADALYFAQEMKPYAFDILFTVVVLVVLEFHLNLSILQARHAGFLVLILLMPWFSIASVFPVSALFLCLAIRELKGGGITKNTIFAAGLWAISFLATWLIEKNQVVAGSNLWVFWNFAFFKPLAPLETICLMADNLINPMHLISPLPFALFMFLWLFSISVILLVGIMHGKKEFQSLIAFGGWALLMTIIVSSVRIYPFHGRTLFFFLPVVLIVFTNGLAQAGQLFGRWQYLLMAILLFTPMAGSVWIRPFDYHRLIRYDGDLDNDYFLLNYGAMKPVPR
ncbi:MAG: hypothetical protein ACKO5E_16865 [bacterium]